VSCRLVGMKQTSSHQTRPIPVPPREARLFMRASTRVEDIRMLWKTASAVPRYRLPFAGGRSLNDASLESQSSIAWSSPPRAASMCAFSRAAVRLVKNPGGFQEVFPLASASLNRDARTAIRRQDRAWNVVRTMKTVDRIPIACSKSSPDAADHNR
jgi:hypothetical protein